MKGQIRVLVHLSATNSFVDSQEQTHAHAMQLFIGSSVAAILGNIILNQIQKHVFWTTA